MSTEENKAIAIRLVEAINRKDMKTVDDLLAANFVEHSAPPGMPPTRQTTLQLIAMTVQAFPDFHYDIPLTVAEGDRVAQHLVAHGTMKGELLGMKPTGKSATWTETHVGRIVNGKFVDHWVDQDQMGMMTQLGLIPVPAGR
jgi:predicted ester cyclase